MTPPRWPWAEPSAMVLAVLIFLLAVALPDLRAWRDGLPPVTFAEEPRHE